MRKLAVPVFLVLFAFSWCFLRGSEPGCASNVDKVFCGDEPVPFKIPIEECTGPLPPNTVCQRGGLAFVSTNTSGTCDFEADTHIQTKKCTDNTDVCDLTSGTTPSLTTPESRNGNQGGPRSHILVALGIVLVLLVGLVLY